MGDHRARGAVFTPEMIGSLLVEAALAGTYLPRSVCDPAAGDGRLLAQLATAHGGSVSLFAADVDDQAWRAKAHRKLPNTHFFHGDSLASGLAAWPNAPRAGFDLVIGNPPFRNQLERLTALTSADRLRLRERYGDVASVYADTASMFLVNACEMTAPGGRVAMIMPLSFLTARDAAPARRRVLELASLSGLWLADALVFPDAAVQVCALILDRHQRAGSPTFTEVETQILVEAEASGPSHLLRWRGPNWNPMGPLAFDPDELYQSKTWGKLTTGLRVGLPDVELSASGRLGDLVTATAGFRSQFYGLAPHVSEGPGPPAGRGDGLSPMITSGLIDTGRVAWGERTTRIAGRTWHHPVIDHLALEADSALRKWVEARLVPKLVVATQTKVLEAVADPSGEWIPSTPVIAVHGDPDHLWRALAVLLAPPASAWAAEQFVGAALSIDALKLSARQVLDIPSPNHERPWAQAAKLLEQSHSHELGGHERETVIEVAHLMTDAYEASPLVFDWWLKRAWPP